MLRQYRLMLGVRGLLSLVAVSILSLAPTKSQQRPQTEAKDNPPLIARPRANGQRDLGTDQLKEDVVAYRKALKAQSREHNRVSWARIQNKLGEALRLLGSREQGVGRFEEALTAYREALNAWDPKREPLEWADSQTKIGIALRLIGERANDKQRLEDAVAAYREALKVRTRARDPLDWAQMQNAIGVTLSMIGERQDGTAKLEQAIAAFREALEEQTPQRDPLGWAESTGNLGIASMRIAERTENEELARTAVDQILAAAEGMFNGGNTAAASFYVKWLLAEAQRLDEAIFQLHAEGRYQQAIPLAQQALAIHERVPSSESPDTANALNSLAVLYQGTGAFAKAEPLFKRALAIYEKKLGPDHRNTASTLNNLADFYRVTGAYAKAEPLFQRALDICEKKLGPDDPDTAGTLNNLAVLYQETGAYAKAEPLYQRTIAIAEKVFGPEHENTARSLNNLARLYSLTGAYAKAEPLYQRALAALEKVLGSDHPDTIATLSNLGLLYQNTGAYEKAEPILQRALALAEKAPGLLTAEAALNNLAFLYQISGAYAKAEPLYKRALVIDEKIRPEHPDTAQLLNNLAILYAEVGAQATAEPLFERVLRIDEVNTARFLFNGNEARKRMYLGLRRSHADVDVSFSVSVADLRAKSLGLTAVLQYKGRVLDVMADNVALLRRSVDPNDQALFDELAAIAQQLSTLTFRGAGNVSAQAYRERLDTLVREQERLEGLLSARSAAFRQAVTPVTLASVRQGLPADAALVEFFRYLPFDPKAKDEKPRWGATHSRYVAGPPRYVAYVLRREGEPSMFDLGVAHEIDKLVSDFRAALSDPTSTSYKKVAEELFGKLIKPMKSSFSEGDPLLLSPDGELNLVPFAALIDEHGQYFVQHHELTYLTSGRDLLGLSSPATPVRSSPVVIADPAYDQSASMGAPNTSQNRSLDLDRSGLVFTPLPGTANEAIALQQLLKLETEQVLTGANATEEKLKGVRGPRILHVATHGFFLSDQQVAAGANRPVSISIDTQPLPFDENPLLRSGLALAGANVRRSGENDDGILTAAEAAQLDLRGTQLVVLSACETGLGQVQQGEGVYGLRRALVLAGAQAQLVSLWKVADGATKSLMVDYYQRLLSGKGRSAAVREAQIASIANPVTQHPYFWAAFVPIGSWTSLETQGLSRPD